MNRRSKGTTTNNAPAVILTDPVRIAKLHELFDALLLHLLNALQNGEEVKASMLEVARHFLASNQITANSRIDVTNGLHALALSALPFDGDDTEH